MEEKEITGIKLWKVVLIVFSLVLIVSIIFLINRPKKEALKNINLNYDNQIVNGLNFEKIKIYSKRDIYYFTARVINTNNYDVNLPLITVRLTGDNSISFNSYIGDGIAAGEYKIITMETKNNLSNIKNVEFNFET